MTCDVDDMTCGCIFVKNRVPLVRFLGNNFSWIIASYSQKYYLRFCDSVLPLLVE